MLTMSTVSRETAVVFFNSLRDGVNVAPILREHVSIGEICLGLLATFVLGWFAGALVALFCNLGSTFGRKEN